MNVVKNSIKKIINFKQDEKVATCWVALTSVNQLKEIEEISTNKTVVIFKHSTRCVISKTVLKRFEEQVSKNTAVQMYLLDLLNYRDLSNKIANSFEVVHQSPQLIVVRSNKVVLHASHYDILQVANNLTQPLE